MAEAEDDEPAAAALRRLVGEIQELCDLYGSPPLFSQDHLRRIDPRWYPLDLKAESKSNSNSCSQSSEEEKDEETQNSPLFKRPRSNPNSQNPLCSTMEAQIWKHFLHDLFEPVLSKLPITSIFRFQSVCSQWRNTINSLTVSKSYPWFYTVTHEDSTNGSIYDPFNKKWHHPTIPFLNRNGNEMVLPVASSGGLVCFLDFSHMYFYVCNPLNKCYKKLPPRAVPFWSRITVGMVSSETGYKIMWLSSDGEYEIYCSDEKKWVHPGPVPVTIKLPLALNFKSQVVSVGTTLYFMRSQPDGILSYDLTTGTWKQYTIPLPAHVRDCTLAELRGRILLVGLLTKNCANCVGIWELQRMTLLWKEVDRMPSELCLELYGKQLKMNCMGCNNGLVLVSLRAKRSNCLVCYDADKRDWVKVPDCVDGLTGMNRNGRWVLCGTAFEPCPSALP